LIGSIGRPVAGGVPEPLAGELGELQCRREKKYQAWVERIAKEHEARLGEGVDGVGVPETP
jgi:hypothetical protein